MAARAQIQGGSGRQHPNRQKVWKPKVRTGCKTCKKRKLKCDEEKPACRRCIQAKLTCDGYDPPPKAWIFEIQSRPSKTQASIVDSDSPSSSSSTSDPEHPPDSSETTVSGSPYGSLDHECTRIAFPDDRYGGDERSHELSLDRLGMPSGPYRGAEEQFFFKYFVEVPGMAASRSGISSSFWLMSFPQIAWSQPAARDALLSSAMKYRHARASLLQDRRTLQLSRTGTLYENRAIRSLVNDPPPLEGVLLASQAFWLNAMVYGDWERSLQHSYHVIRLCAAVEDRSKHDLLILRYCEALAKSCLGYFRITRGPCRLHPLRPAVQQPNLLACSASCYVPERIPVEMRVADALHHLRKVPLALFEHRKALDDRPVPHSQHDRIVTLLEKMMTEVTWLTNTWGDLERLEMDPHKVREAQQKVPFTRSPFPTVLDALAEYIERDEDSKTSFVDLELRMRITMPNLGVSTGREDPRFIAHFLTRILGTPNPRDV